MDKKLLTPGPLTTSSSTKEAMLHDWGSRDKNFINLNQSIRKSLVKLINGEDDFECVPMQGSGTFAVESMIGSLTSKNDKILILINGAYGNRMKKICDYLNRSYVSYEVKEFEVHDIGEIEKIIDSYGDITHVFIVYCETTSGILNPIEEIAHLINRKKLSLFIDAMSAFGALPLSSKKIKFDAIAASSNKCLEGVPGVGFVLVKKNIIEKAKNNSHSLSLDLYDQWQAMQKNKQWRFTPPTHVLAAFYQALAEHKNAGGIEGRYRRYSNNCLILCDGMKELGFKKLLPNSIQSPIIITFMQPQNSNFNFQSFYNCLSKKGFLIYPGKLTTSETFRIGCIGNLDSIDMYNTVEAIKDVMKELKIKIH